MSLLETAQVLRGVALHSQARPLERPMRQRSAGTAGASLPREAPSAETAVQAPARVDEIHERAHREGFERGLDEGRASGFEVGLAAGREEGHAAGREEGLAAGREEGLASGREEGLAAGREAGEAAVREARRDELARLAGVVRQAADQVARRIEQAEEDMLELVFEIVCRIAGDSAITRDGARRLVKHSIAQLAGSPLVSVRMHAQDVAQLRGDAELAAMLDAAAKDDVKWLADERVQLGGCLLESASGTLDATLETQLQRLRDTLLATRRARTPGTSQGSEAC
jgi:flagellar assembly protein FliH